MPTTVRGGSGGTQSTAPGARVIQQLPLALASVLLMVACSNSPAEVGQVSTSTSGPATTTIDDDASPNGVLYVQHGWAASIERNGDSFTVLIEGVDRRTEWFTAATSGVTTTGQLVDEWGRLGLDDPAPQAVIVPADYTSDPVLLSLADPIWDEETQALEYEGSTVDDPDPRLAGMAHEASDDPAGVYLSVTVFLHQPAGTEVPSPTIPTTTTTTTTTTTSTTTMPTTTSTSAPTTPSTGITSTTAFPGVSVTPASTFPPTSAPVPTTDPPGPTVTRPPDGEPEIIADVTDLRVESVGGSSTTFTLRNVGSGVGSWSTAVPGVTGLSLAPSSGLLFPGSSTVVRVTYDGSGPNNDFAANIILTTASGRTVIQIKVYPPPD